MLRTYIARSGNSETKLNPSGRIVRRPISVYPQHTLASTFEIDTAFFTHLLSLSSSVMSSQSTSDILSDLMKRMNAISSLDNAPKHKIIVGIDYGTTFSGMQVVFCLNISNFNIVAG